MVFTVGLMYYMPKMMEGLEPEERERMQKQMAMQQNPSAMLGELFGGLGGGEEPQPQPAAAATAKSSAGSSPNKKKIKK